MLNIPIHPWELFVILFAFIGFGLLGLYDDFKKLINGREIPFFGLRLRYKFLIQWILAFVIAFVLNKEFGYSFIFISGIVLTSLGFLYIPFAAFIILGFPNAAI